MKENNNNGLPVVDNTPMGVIGMEGNLFRGIVSSKMKRPTWVRVIAICLSLFFVFVGVVLLIPLIYIAKDLTHIDFGSLLNIALPILFGALFSGAGIMGVITNIKK